MRGKNLRRNFEIIKEKFDFHVHSHASDGSLSPHDVVIKASQEHIEVIAITDHDTTAGVEEAVKAGKELGVTVIPGVEISIDFEPGTMHMCGYFIDIENEQLKKALEFVQQARLNRNPLIVKKLNDAGVDITMQEIAHQAQGEQIGRPHFAKVLLKKGYVDNTKEAFTKYLAKGAPCYVDKERLSLKQAVTVIRNAGGIAVLAHPRQLSLGTKQEYKDFFENAKNMGVEGIESYSSHHSQEQNVMFKQLADELALLITAGSDFHGETKPDVQLGVFGEKAEVDVSALLKKMNRLTIEGKTYE